MKVSFHRPVVRSGGDLYIRSPITFQAEAEKETPKLLGTQAFEDLPGDWPYQNPDELVGAKGLTVFSKMLREDEMLFSSSCYLSLATISPGFRVDPGDDTTEAMRAAEFQNDQFALMQGSLNQLCLDIIDAAFRGFAVIEPEYGARQTRGKWIGKQMVSAMRAKNPAYIEFKVDSYGAVEENGLWQLDYTGAGPGMYRKVDLQEVIYAAFWPRDDNPYGSPLLRPAYPYYFAKDFGLKQWWTFLEKFGHPIIMGKVEKGLESGERTQYLQMLTKLWKNLVAVVAGDVQVEMHQPDYKSTDQFEAMLRFCNRALARSLLLPALVMEHDGSTGSLAMAKEQGSEGQFTWILKHFADMIEQVINEQFIDRTHRLNFGDRIPRPTFKINDYAEEDLKMRAEIYSSLSLVGMPFSVPALRKEFNIPEGDSGDLMIGGRPAGGGLLNDELIRVATNNPAATELPGVPPGTPPEKVAAIRHEMTRKAFELAYDPPTPTRTVVSMASPNAVPTLDEHISFDQTNIEEDIAAEWWGQIGAIVIEDMADAVKEQEGKGNGTRLLR